MEKFKFVISVQTDEEFYEEHSLPFDTADEARDAADKRCQELPYTDFLVRITPINVRC